MRWMAKAATQKVLSAVPRAHVVNRRLQQIRARSRSLDKELQTKWGQTIRHVELLRAHGLKLEESQILEIGTGRRPLNAVGLRLLGARRVVSFDIAPLATPDGTAEAITFLRRTLGEDFSAPASAAALLNRDLDSDPFERLRDANVQLLVGQIQDHVRNGESFDAAISNDTLEHIPTRELDNLFSALFSLLRPRGLMSHHINMADHYASFDPRIGKLNFLRYSDTVWRIINSKLHYQNRLRLSDYRLLHERHGFHVLEENGLPIVLSRDALPHKVAKRYRSLSLEDASTLYSWFVSMKQ